VARCIAVGLDSISADIIVCLFDAADPGLVAGPSHFGWLGA